MDVVHFAFNEAMPKLIVALGEKLYVDDNLETPDTMMAVYHYPGFIANYEHRTCSPTPLLNQGTATAFHGTKGTLVVNRRGYWILPGGKSVPTVEETTPETQNWKIAEPPQMNVPHCANFLECIKTRQKPISDIETCVRSTFVCLLTNISMRFQTRLDWDDKNQTVLQEEAKKYLRLDYRKPWKLEV
jgi:predicted dehydrogenase